MDKSNSEEKNNNVILLIVIAIATMVIVVVGATFAYLSDIVENEGIANISGKTEGGSDMFLLDAGDILSLNVSYDNFGINNGDQTDSTVASVALAAGKDGISHKYDMYLEVINNDFEYTSGKCYLANKQAAKVNAETMEDCVGGGNLWARSASEEEYSCYPKTTSTEVLLDTMNNNELICDRFENAIWAKEAVPELVLDLYTPSAEKNEDSCMGEEQSKGVCLKPSGSIEEGSKAECTDGTWIANTFKAGKCYKFSKRVDITEAKGANNRYEIIKNKSITSSVKEDVTDYYLVTIRMINLNSNQVINTSKLFSGSLVLTIVDENVQTAH